MFDSLSNNLSKIFDKLRGKAVLSEDDINLAMREVRIALLEADVALPVIKDFIARIKEKALNQDVIKKVSAVHQVIKIVSDELTEILGSSNAELALNNKPPVIIMLVGLQGAGKTSTAAKLGYKLEREFRRKTLLVSLDTYRPAAQKQLAVLAEQGKIASLPIIEGENPLQISKRALEFAKTGGYETIILDTAGRLHQDEVLIKELQDIKAIAKPQEIILVADALTGQDAVNIASHFNEALSLSGIILTRMDGDARGGAALSMRYITGCPIKFVGMGEKLTDLSIFYPDRAASSILDMGDIVSLVEKAAQNVDQEEAEKLAAKLQKGKFDLEDLAKQMKMIKKLGGLGSILGFLPGFGQIKNQIQGEEGNMQKAVDRQIAIISSMTPKERRNPEILNASRRRRIAAGSGMKVQDVNKLMKQFDDMRKMMKQISKMDKKSLMRKGNMFK